jgi:cellulose synthase/poly-beta-1,6-N-acetylglucosamine synthase-like glycosyltransferase
MVTFVIFAFSHFRTFRIFAYIAHFAFSHISRISCSCIYRVFCVSAYFAFSCFLRFDMCYCVPPWDPLHSVRISCPHPPRSIGAYFTLFHSHYIIYVLAFPFMFNYLIMYLYYITLVHLALPTWLRGLGTHLAC